MTTVEILKRRIRLKQQHMDLLVTEIALLIEEVGKEEERAISWEKARRAVNGESLNV